METFTKLKPFVDNPHYDHQRRRCLETLDLKTLDPPILKIVRGFLNLPYCFTLQSCFGHFLFNRQQDPMNIEPLPASDSITTVEYKIAYIALCIENCNPGKDFFQDLKKVPMINPEYIQFGCADWFWERQANSYALQVEPERNSTEDRIRLNYQEALEIEKVRNRFFAEINDLLQYRLGKKASRQST
ncbi:hypothetical protein ACFL9T_16770 [Thermodesulfobacteriota bacterium]